MSIKDGNKPGGVVSGDDGYTTEFDVSIYPEMDVDYEHMIVKVPPVRKVTPEALEARKKALQKQAGKKEIGPDDQTQIGDYVKLNIRKIEPVDKNDPDADEFDRLENLNGFKLILDDRNEFHRNVIGHKVGEDLEFEMAMPDEFALKKLVGKQTKISCHIVKVWRNLSMDEVGEKLGVNNEEGLNEDLTRSMNEYYANIHDKKKRELLMKELTNLVSEDLLPMEIVEAKAKQITDSMKRQAEQYGLDPNELAKMQGNETIEDLGINLAKADVKVGIVLRAIASKENLTVQDDELDKYMARYGAKLPAGAANSMPKSVKQGMAMIEKALDLLAEKVTFEEVDSSVLETLDVSDQEAPIEEPTVSEDSGDLEEGFPEETVDSGDEQA